MNNSLQQMAELMQKIASAFIANQISEYDLRSGINLLALMERELPYPNQSAYIVGDACYNTLKGETIISTDNCFAFRINTILPNRGFVTNRFVKDFVFDCVLNECRIDLNKISKIHIHTEQFIKPTQNGKLNKDCDNNEKKGVIDGVAEALGIDDTGDRIAYSSTIKALSCNDTPHTIITLLPEKEVDDFFLRRTQRAANVE